MFLTLPEISIRFQNVTCFRVVVTDNVTDFVFFLSKLTCTAAVCEFFPYIPDLTIIFNSNHVNSMNIVFVQVISIYLFY